VRSLADTGTTVYSLTFSPAKPRSKSHSSSPARSGAPISLRSLDDTASSKTRHPLIPFEIVKAIHEDTTAEVVALSGGEQFRFRDEQELESNLSIVARDIQNGYTLSFYPSSHEAGFHAITVQVVQQSPHLKVKSRASYWFDGTPTK
jgi:hypothetical protein